MLEEKGALEKLAAMEAGSKNKVPIEERPGLAEKSQQIFGHWAGLSAGGVGRGNYPEVSLTVLPLPAGFSATAAITSISTLAPLGRAATATVERAGGFSRK